MPRHDPVAELAQKLVDGLQQARSQGPAGYPLTVAALAARAAPEAGAEQVHKALAKKAFAARFCLARKKDLGSPLALAEDAEQLADSPLLWSYALGLLCSPSRPLHPPERVASKLDKSLRPAFLRAAQRRLESGKLPPSVEALTGLGGPQLLLPERLSPTSSLALQMLHGLIACRGDDDYPLPLSRLVARVDSDAGDERIRQALKDRLLAPRIVLAITGHPDSPVVLREDSARLSDWSAFIPAVLQTLRSAENQALPVRELARKVSKPLQPAFAQTLERHLSSGHLPPEVGLLRIKRASYLFLLSDLQAAPPAPAISSRQQEAGDFANQLETAFERLDRAGGGHNLVSLVDLRAAVPVSRIVFDAGLQQLRRAGRYSLSAAEGRAGISPQEQAAGLREEGALLLYVSRRK